MTYVRDDFEFYEIVLGSLYGFGEHKPGRTNLFEQFQAWREQRLEEKPIDITRALTAERGGIGTPEDMRKQLRKFEELALIRSYSFSRLA